MKNLAKVLILLSLFGCYNKQIKNNEINQKDIEKNEDPIEFKTLLDLHNNARYKNLALDKDLCKLAQKQSDYILKKRKLIHSDLSKLEYKLIGENIAYGQNSEKEVFNDWMNSYEHKKNILNKNYNKVGFGKSISESGVVYWCAIFTN